MFYISLLHTTYHIIYLLCVRWRLFSYGFHQTLQNGESSHVLRIFDEEAQAMQSARNSSRMLEEANATGVAILSKYAEQRDRIKVSIC